jgi:hypothetical protein
VPGWRGARPLLWVVARYRGVFVSEVLLKNANPVVFVSVLLTNSTYLIISCLYYVLVFIATVINALILTRQLLLSLL